MITYAAEPWSHLSLIGSPLLTRKNMFYVVLLCHRFICGVPTGGTAFRLSACIYDRVIVFQGEISKLLAHVSKPIDLSIIKLTVCSLHLNSCIYLSTDLKSNEK